MLKLGKLNKLLKMWGINEPAHTVEGALEKLCDYPPFGVKTEMVEIVPEQSVTNFMGAEYAYGIYNPYLTLNNIGITTETKVVITINGVKYYPEIWEENDKLYAGNKYLINGGENTNEVYACVIDSIATSIHWDKSLGETITLGVYKVQEDITPLDPKLVGKAPKTRFYIRSSMGKYMYRERTLQTKVTKNEFLAVDIDNVIICYTDTECRPIYVKNNSSEFVVGIALEGQIGECWTAEYEEEPS